MEDKQDKPKPKKRTINDPEFCAFDKNHGYYVVTGKVMTATGKAKKAAPFWLGWDKREALRRKTLVRLEWKRVVNGGGKYWNETAYASLERLGVITARKGRNMKNRDDPANALAPPIEPLSPSDLKPLVDESGRVRPDTGLKAMETDALYTITDAGFRSRFHEQLVQAGKEDPWGALERLKRTFDWNAEKAQQFMFSFGTGGPGGPASPSAYDATATGTNPLDLIEGEVVEPTETVETVETVETTEGGDVGSDTTDSDT